MNIHEASPGRAVPLPGAGVAARRGVSVAAHPTPAVGGAAGVGPERAPLAPQAGATTGTGSTPGPPVKGPGGALGKTPARTPSADWRDSAICGGIAWLMNPPPDLTAGNKAAAVARCRRCPVTIDCLSWVLSLPERSDPGGIAGGTTEQERTHLRALIQQAAAGGLGRSRRVPAGQGGR